MNAMAVDQPLSTGEILEKLERVGNLESVITEQRMRMEKLKTTYEILKTEHIQLQEQNNLSQKAATEAKDEVKLIQRHCQDLITKARSEKDSKIQECEDLRSQVLTPQKMEILKMRLQSEIEQPYRKRLEILEHELQRSKSDYNKLRYDYSFLKSEYEHEHSLHQRMQDETKNQYETKLVSLQRERDMLMKKHEDINDSHRVRTLQRENTQLNLKVKSLLNELEELRAKRESAGLQSDHISKLQVRQLAEATSHCKELEADNESLKSQCQRLQNELGKNEKQQDDIMTQLYERENECNTLKSALEDEKHKHKLEISNVKMELTKNRGDMERECDRLKLECDSLKNKLSVFDNTVEHLNNVITEKEQEVCKRIQVAKEKEWEKLNEIEQNNLQLQSTIAELERKMGDDKISHHEELKKMEEELRSISEIKEILEQETSNLRHQLKQKTDLSDDLVKEKEKTQELKEKQQKLQTELQSVLNSEQNLMAANERLKNTVDLLNDEIGIARSDLQHAQLEQEQEKEKTKKSFEDEKLNLEQTFKEKQQKLMDDLKAGKKKIDALSKKREKSKNEIKELKESMKILQAKEEMARTETDVVRKNMEADNERLRKQFDRLKKRQIDFRNMLNNTDTVFPQAAAISSTPLKFSSHIFEQNELSSVRDRLDDITESQQRQEENLRSFTNLTSTTNFHEVK